MYTVRLIIFLLRSLGVASLVRTDLQQDILPKPSQCHFSIRYRSSMDTHGLPAESSKVSQPTSSQVKLTCSSLSRTVWRALSSNIYVGTVLSATMPIATIAKFRNLGVFSALYSLQYAESVPTEILSMAPSVYFCERALYIFIGTQRWHRYHDR